MPIHSKQAQVKNYTHIGIGELIVISMVVENWINFFLFLFIFLYEIAQLFLILPFQLNFNAQKDRRRKKTRERMKWRRWRSTKITIKMYQMKLNAKLQLWKCNKWKYLHEKKQAEKKRRICVFNKNWARERDWLCRMMAEKWNVSKWTSEKKEEAS